MSTDHTPRRIVSLQPSATVILASLGQLDRVVACTRYCADVCPEAAHGRAIISDSWTANSDEILASRPDLVVAAVPYQEKAIAEILKSGARFLGLAPKTLADIYTDISTIAGVVGASDKGETVIRDMQQQIEAIRIQTRDAHPPRVFCEEWGKPLISSQPWVAELVEAAGGQFVGEPGVQRSLESVLAEDPDILIAAWCGVGDRVPLEKIVRDRGWGEMRAVREGRVYCVRDELLNTPAPTLIAGLRALAAAIHPERFPASSGVRQMSELRSTVREHGPRL
ncbi:MAG TPA: ABC transporter substrate-binding protein [Terriglobales bacterium]|jgi:iron complex transport system substrate-binding protein|nr:ABC transporter substrate-binding protein [Terriglobales bacterium]